MDTITANTMLKGFSRTGALDRAKDMLINMRRVKVNPNAISYNTVGEKIVVQNLKIVIQNLNQEIRFKTLTFQFVHFSYEST